MRRHRVLATIFKHQGGMPEHRSWIDRRPPPAEACINAVALLLRVAPNPLPARLLRAGAGTGGRGDCGSRCPERPRGSLSQALPQCGHVSLGGATGAAVAFVAPVLGGVGGDGCRCEVSACGGGGR